MHNALNDAASPFLLSHKDNPIQWRLWGAEALAEAKAADKPILLNLGYGGCHWCHVMNRESFADAAIAEIINENYIPILVDRDERPDLDLIYQGAAGTMGSPGGWPLNIFLTPDGAPFWVATYLPPTEKPGQPGFRRVLGETAELFQKDRAKVDTTANTVRAALENLYNRDMAAPQGDINLDMAALRIAQRYDIFFGGLQGQQKFLHPLMLEVIWRAFLRTGTVQFSQILFTSLDSILFGGVYDHVGGGFFRHSLDERWLEPSFEKMLYDNAQMIDLCTQVFQFNRNELCRQRVTETIGWLLRDMKVGDGFAAAQSSGSQIEDGKYYLWSEAEMDAALVGTFSARFKQIYGVTRDGNVSGKNLPMRLGNPVPANEADEALLAKQREMLMAARGKRAKPVRDERLVADWNGLTIHALARAGMVFEKPEWIQLAVAAFDYVVAELGRNDGRLMHMKTGAAPGQGGFADDYADMARAALQLWEVTGDARFIESAKGWTDVLNRDFWSDRLGGYFYYAADAEQLFVRPRMLFDNPAPAANGTMLMVLTRLAMLTGDTAYMERASVQAATFGTEAGRVLQGSGGYFGGFEYLMNSLMIVVIGHKGNARTQELVRAFWGKPVPSGMLIQIEPGDALPAGHPAAGRSMENGQPTAFICQAGNCSNGFTSAESLAHALILPPTLRAQQPQQRTA
jgi:uncharacterized protein YyaL (SSP411 family)